MLRIRVVTGTLLCVLGGWIPAARAGPVDLRLSNARGLHGPTADVRDAAGGTLVAWHVVRPGTGADIVLHRIGAGGAAAGAWKVADVLVCGAAGDQWHPAIAGDGAGGAYVVWEDARAAVADGAGARSDIYAHHVDADGLLDPRWPAAGRRIGREHGLELNPVVVEDGAGGIWIAWDDLSGETGRVLARHVDGAPDRGRFDSPPTIVCAAADEQDSPVLVADSVGTVLVVWRDHRASDHATLCATRLLASGAADPRWPREGLVVSGGGDVADPAARPDGNGGAWIAWTERRTDDGDVFAQHVLASGVADPAWAAAGVAVCAAPGSQDAPTLLDDGRGGVVLAWQDGRVAGQQNVYATRLLASGARDPAWAKDGIAVSTAAAWQVGPRIVTDREGGTLVTWLDGREAAPTRAYAGRVLASGVVDPAWEKGGIAFGAAADGAPALVPDGQGGALATWHTLDGTWANGIDTDGPSGHVRALWTLGFAAPAPNPSSHHVRFAFTLPVRERVLLEVFDIAGRRVTTLENGVGDAGPHQVRWDLRAGDGHRVYSGVYFARLAVPDRVLNRRIVVIQ